MKENNKNQKIYALIVSINIFFIIILSSLYIVSFNENFYHKQFEKNSIYEKIDASKQEIFEKGKTFPNCELLFNQKKFQIKEATIAATFANKDADGNVIEGTKVGVSFSQFEKKTEEELTIHINSEARAEEIQRYLKERKAQS